MIVQKDQVVRSFTNLTIRCLNDFFDNSRPNKLLKCLKLAIDLE